MADGRAIIQAIWACRLTRFLTVIGSSRRGFTSCSLVLATGLPLSRTTFTVKESFRSSSTRTRGWSRSFFWNRTLSLGQRLRLLAGEIENHNALAAVQRKVTTSVLRKRDQRIADLREAIRDLLDWPTDSQTFIEAKNAANTLLEQPDD